MEEFIFIAPDGYVFREETNPSIKYRHGDIARNYMNQRNLEIKQVDIKEQNGYPWGLELTKYHSTFVIQDGGWNGIIYIPVKLTDAQIEWVKKYLLIEIELMDGQIFICNFIENDMRRYDYYAENIMEKLKQCLKEKGVDITINKEVNNDVGYKRSNI